MNIGQRIKERRKELGMSADVLGEKIGKSRATVFRYENGDIENLPLDILKPIAEALCTTPAFILGWDVEEIESVSSIQEDANTYEDAYETELKELFAEFSKMNLTTDELKDVFNYASFVKSKRK